MFATKPLSSIKNAIPSIHQPLPLSSKQSKKLLNVLKTSFRKNLDKEHGFAPETTDLSAAKATSLTHSPSRPTDQHLRSILSNPLFKIGAQLGNVPSTSSSPRDPMDVFDEAVSRGMMTNRAAQGCLKAKRLQILQSSTLSVEDSMAASAAGLRVVQWLRSSGQERNLEFLADVGLSRELLTFMVAEGLEEVAWTWADRLVRGEGPADGSSQIVGFLVANLVRAKSRLEDRSLDTAFSTMLRAETTWKTNSQLPQILWQPFRHLSWEATVDAWKRPLPSAPLYESFARTATYQRPLIKTIRLDRAHLDLHHPTNPDHTGALAVLRWFLEDRGTLEGDGRLPRRLRTMAMDIVTHLTKIGRAESADTVLRLLHDNSSTNPWQQPGPLNVTLGITPAVVALGLPEKIQSRAIVSHQRIDAAGSIQMA
ncbi:hypothetical protein CABS01_02192 [Colletotrichum abscissum]|nr:uncharacterized protein CABS01_02192 [Colletotrichum abscissum]KAK1488562.1 hypothetical protein CABS01_02192 [Colletotrichum abscissum]